MNQHLSHFALDLAALGGDLPSGVDGHLEACPACSAALAERRSADPAPVWVNDLRVPPAAAPARPPPRPPSHPLARRRLLWLLSLPAVAAVAALLLRPAPPADPAAGSTREKGAPVVTVYVKRGDLVTAWDGRAPVLPGDRLRVAVRGTGFGYLSVASVQPGVAPDILYAGPLEPSGETLLPLSFRVDAGGAAENLSIVLSVHPVAPGAHALPPEQTTRQGGWSTRLHLPKETSR